MCRAREKGMKGFTLSSLKNTIYGYVRRIESVSTQRDARASRFLNPQISTSYSEPSGWNRFSRTRVNAPFGLSSPAKAVECSSAVRFPVRAAITRGKVVNAKGKPRRGSETARGLVAGDGDVVSALGSAVCGFGTRGTTHCRGASEKVKSRPHCFQEYLHTTALFVESPPRTQPHDERARSRDVCAERGSSSEALTDSAGDFSRFYRRRSKTRTPISSR